MKRVSRATRTLSVSLLFLCLQSGYGQVWFINFDGAPVLRPGQIEASLLASGSYMNYDGQTLIKGLLPGIRAGVGITSFLDVKASYTRGFYKFNLGDLTDWEDTKGNNFTLSPKFSFLGGKLAVKLPFSVMWYKDGELSETYYNLGPRVIFSLRHKKYVERSLSPFFEVFFYDEGESDYSAGGNLGFAFSSDLDRWSIRPEGYVGYIFPKGEQEKGILVYGWGLAATVSFDVFTRN